MKKLLLAAFICIAAAARSQNVGVTAINLENIGYPYPVNFLDVAIEGNTYQMAYMDVKPEKPNGKTVVLLHGKNFCGAYWGQTAKTLAELGYRIIIPDQIGFGKSSKPEHLQYSFQMLANNTRLILDELGIMKATIVGHSMGGMLATRFALMFPEATEKLVLENPIGLEDWQQKVPYKPIDWWYENEMAATYESIKDYQLTNYYGGNWKPEYDQWLDIQAGWTKNQNYKIIAWNSALTYDMIFTQPVCYEFYQLQVSTLLIIGQRDRTALGKNLVSPDIASTMGDYPELGKKTASLIPGSTLVELDNVGHLPHIEDFNKFIAPLKEFLKKP